MQAHAASFTLNHCLAAVRGAALVASLSLGIGLVQQASAGCLDIPGVKHLSGALNPLSLGESPRFVKAGFKQVAYEEYERHQAPIVGLWAFKYFSEGNTALGLANGMQLDGGNTTWFADGNEITYSGIRNPATGAVCLGVWEQTGERTYVLNHIGLSWNPVATDKLKAGPAGPAFIRQAVELSRDGQSYSGTFEIDQLLPDGKTLSTPAPIRGKITATRVNIFTDTQVP